MNKGRSKSYQRDNRLMEVLTEVNTFTKDFSLKSTATNFQYRPLIIMGCARSGSTMFLQALANTGVFAYPSNLISRFYTNPSFGALVQKMLIEYDSKKQIFDSVLLEQSQVYKSDLGHTKGALAPSEFWYFWRQYFKFGEIQYLDESALAEVDIEGFLKHLVSFETIYNQPLLMKGMILNWNIPYLYQHIPNALFVHIKREPFFVAQSLLECREKFFGDINKWWSFKPVEYPQLQNLSAAEQVAGQVYYTNQASVNGLEALPEESKMVIDYESFCQSPGHYISDICTKIGGEDIGDFDESKIPANFRLSNQVRLEDELANDLRIALAKYY